MVFYRKYRPQTIDDLDSNAVRDTLHAALQKNIPHAFLFTGPKGLGKTSTARIVAKVVNCEKRDLTLGIEPCNSCDQCLAITNGTSLDVLEIDAASNRGIDEIRELKEKIRLAPVSSRKKVYIIDEVHMLTTEAFNALLKTLEEPPEHAMFILCTTESHKVPATIMSRCFHITFKPAADTELVRSFKRIVKGEKIAMTDEALMYIAQLADKGFRDGVKVLEEIISLAGDKEITLQVVEEKYQATSIKQQVEKMIGALQSKDTKKGVEIVGILIEQGADVKYFLQLLMEQLHDNLLARVGIKNKEVNDKNEKLTLEEMKVLFELLTKAYGEMKYSVLSQLPLELAIIAWGEEEKNESSKVQPQEKNVASQKSSIVAEEVSISSLRKQVGTMKKIKALYGSDPKKSNTEEEPAISTTTIELLQTSGDDKVTEEWMELFWKNLLNEMKKYNHTVAGVLRGCMIKSYADQKLIIQTSYKFHKERLDDMKNREALLNICKLLTGKEIEITIELKGSV